MLELTPFYVFLVKTGAEDVDHALEGLIEEG